jgi:hypothetical protein
MTKYILKKGVHELEPNTGDYFTAETMTDAIAIDILSRCPWAIDHFETPVVGSSKKGDEVK